MHRTVCYAVCKATYVSVQIYVLIFVHTNGASRSYIRSNIIKKSFHTINYHTLSFTHTESRHRWKTTPVKSISAHKLLSTELFFKFFCGSPLAANVRVRAAFSSVPKHLVSMQ